MATELRNLSALASGSQEDLLTAKRPSHHEHDAILSEIGAAMASDQWGERLAVVEVVQGLFRDRPTERTVERLVEILDRFAQDSKWEVRRAVVPALVDARRPAASRIIDRLAADGNQWVRQAAARAKRKLARVTTPAEKRDNRALFAFEATKDLDGKSKAKIYEAALRVGERHYEELARYTAHDLNTYRMVMESHLQDLEIWFGKRGKVGSDVSEIFAKIRDRSRYLKALVSDLLEYTRDADLDFQLQPLRPMLSEALNLARDKANAYLAGQEVEVEVILDVCDEIELDASKDRLVRALVNILSNAFESLSGKTRGARVEIRAGSDGTELLTVSITDTGSGMDALQMENATKPFRSQKKKQGGTGLGLPFALKIIEREHQGRLDIESKVGTGTTIKIELPIKRKAA